MSGVRGIVERARGWPRQRVGGRLSFCTLRGSWGATSPLGSSYELDYLVDHYPLSRVLFLVDATTDVGGLQQQLRDSCKSMSPDSPNWMGQPVVNIYLLADRPRRELRRITETLCNLAIPQPSVDVDAFTLLRYGGEWRITALGDLPDSE